MSADRGWHRPGIDAHKAEELLVKSIIDGRLALERIAAGHQLLAEIEMRKRTAAVIMATGTTITDIHGIGPLTATITIGRVGDIRRFPTAGHLARHNGTGPIEAILRTQETTPVEPAR